MDHNIIQLINNRHSVRHYKQMPLKTETKQTLTAYLRTLNSESGLDIRLIDNTNNVFGGLLLKIAGWKKPPTAYFVFVGDRTPESDERCGYFGEKLVIFAQSLGLNTCWVGMFNKSEMDDDIAQSAIITIAVGYGENSGKARKTKSPDKVSSYVGTPPQWFIEGVKCALLAPTAINKQGFMIKGEKNKVSITYNSGMFSAIDLGIVKYHFEQGAGKENFVWGN